MDLDEFLRKLTENDNIWWMLDSGELQVFFYALLERYEELLERYQQETGGKEVMGPAIVGDN